MKKVFLMKKIRNKINGLLLLNKPLGISSNDAIQKVKRALNAEKVGHTGTLDPMATGLLPVCLGEATKFANFLLDGDKEYIATAKLGIITDSGDSEGKIVATNIVNISLPEVESAIKNFTGDIKQVPPMYSALKFNGRPLYEYAREGIFIERLERSITIHELELINYSKDKEEIIFRAKVSKGTYIRTLAEDIGNYLGCGASLIALQRTESYPFKLSDAYNIEQILEIGDYSKLNILPVDILCNSLSILEVNDKQFTLIKNGNQCRIYDCKFADNAMVRLYYQGKFYGVAEIRYQEDRAYICPLRMISREES